MEISTFPPGCPGDTFERRKRQAAARLELALLKRHDPIVESHREMAAREDLSPAMIESWRQRRRNEYRLATGIEIEQRDALATGLASIVETGNGSVEELIGQLQRDYAKGLSSVLDGSVRTGEGR